MKTLTVEYKKLDPKQYYRKPVTAEPDDALVISEPCLIHTSGGHRILIVDKSKEIDPLMEALLGIDIWDSGSRASGLATTSAIFGYMPRTPTRNHRDWCSEARMGRENPWQHQTLVDYAKVAEGVYKEFLPDLWEKHRNITTEKVRSDYHMAGTCFTSGICNKTNALAYHLDRGNFDGVSSAMFVAKRDTSGGRLHVPELNTVLDLWHGSLVLFDGQSLWHGVTPIKRLSKNAVRFSTVYYSLKQMWQCMSIEDELKRGRQIRTEREIRKAGLAT